MIRLARWLGRAGRISVAAGAFLGLLGLLVLWLVAQAIKAAIGA